MLRKVVPLGLKKVLRKKVKKIFGFKDATDIREDTLRRRKKQEDAIRKIDLEQKNINNLKVLLDRDALLAAMPKNAICAEIGVNKGEFSKDILRITHPKKLHLIDAWGDASRYHDDLKFFVNKLFAEQIESGQVEINVGFSTEVLKKFPDRYFVWVYLDTDHSYKNTTEELAILKHKVKPDGIIAGHDYTIGNWIGDYRYGVIEAVHELCVKEGWELIYLTNETHQCRNFAIRKLL
jgi:hypothetical protein